MKYIYDNKNNITIIKENNQIVKVIYILKGKIIVTNYQSTEAYEL